MSGKSKHFIELLRSMQSSLENKSFLSAIKNPLKNRDWTFPVEDYFIENRVHLKYF